MLDISDPFMQGKTFTGEELAEFESDLVVLVTAARQARWFLDAITKLRMIPPGQVIDPCMVSLDEALKRFDVVPLPLESSSAH